MTAETHQPGRFLTLDQAAEELATSHSQLYALVRRGDLPALKLGGRGQWRIERAALETYIEEMYAQTKRLVDEDRVPGLEP